jgi:hypothetical protein
MVAACAEPMASAWAEVSAANCCGGQGVEVVAAEAGDLRSWQRLDLVGDSAPICAESSAASASVVSARMPPWTGPPGPRW